MSDYGSGITFYRGPALTGQPPTRPLNDQPIIRIVVPGEPVPLLRPRVVRPKNAVVTIAYTPDKSVAYQEKIRIYAIEAIHASQATFPLAGPLAIVAHFYRSRPKSIPKSLRHPTQKPDLDNLVKQIDALKGLLWHDDSQICLSLCQKLYAQPGQARFELTVHAVYTT